MDKQTENLLFKYPIEKDYQIKYLDNTLLFDPKSKSSFNFKSTTGRKEPLKYTIDRLVLKSDDSVKAVFVKFLMKTNISCLMSQMCMMYKNSDDVIKLLSAETNDIKYRIDIEIIPEYDNIDRQGNITKLPIDISSRIMEDFDIKDNTLYFIRLEDWVQKNPDVDLSMSDGLQNVNGIIKKYWPYLKNRHIKREFSEKELKEIKEVSDRYKEIFFEEFLRIREVDESISGINTIIDSKNDKGVHPNGFEFYHLQLRRDLDGKIDIKTLFNNIDLSDDIPVSMYHSDKFINNRYKIYKESVKNVTLSQFKEWKSGIELLPEVDTIHYNQRKNTVTFHIKIKDGCFCVVDIYQEDPKTGNGYIEITMDKSSMNKITFNNEEKFKTKISQMVSKINNVCLKECKNYINEIELLDELEVGDFFSSRLKTKIVEMGGKLSFSVTQKCGSDDINISDKITENIKEYYPYVRVREESPHENEERETLIGTGTKYVYKRKSDYTKLDSLEAIIIPLVKEQIEKGEIINILLSKNNLPLTYEEAEYIVDSTIQNFVENERKFKKDKIERGISCRINDEGEYVDLIFDSVKSELELKRLCLFNSVFIFDIHNNNSLKKRIEDTRKQFLKVKSSSPKSSKSKSDKKLDQQIEQKEEVEESNVSENSATASDTSSESDEYAGGKYNKNRYHLNEIKKHDSNLVSYKAKNTDSSYVRKCPAGKNRHPYIVKDIAHLDRIEARWKAKKIWISCFWKY